MRSLKLKVCGMRDPANIMAVGALRPDFMGFIFVPSSPRYVGPTLRAEQIAIPSTVGRIGVFKDASLDTVIELAHACNLTGAQLHGDEGVDYMSALKRALPELLIIKAVNVQGASDIARLSVIDGTPDIFLLDGKNPGSGASFDWELLSRYQAPVDFLLAGGIGVSEISTVVKLAGRCPRLLGVDINSRVESAPGVKDVSLVQEALARLSV